MHTPAGNAVAWLLPTATPVQLYGIDGTLGHGSVAALRYRKHPIINDLQWKLHPWWLLTGRVAVDLKGGHGDPRLHGNVQLSRSSLRASGLVLDIQLKTLLADAGYSFLPINGLLHVNVKHGQVSKTQISALNATATLHSLRWDMGKTPLELGDFSAHATRTGKGGVDVALASVSGPLDVSGTATLDAKGHYTLDLKIKARPDASKTVVNLVQQMGRPDASGFHQVHYHGQAPWPDASENAG